MLNNIDSLVTLQWILSKQVFEQGDLETFLLKLDAVEKFDQTLFSAVIAQLRDLLRPLILELRNVSIDEKSFYIISNASTDKIAQRSNSFQSNEIEFVKNMVLLLNFSRKLFMQYIAFEDCHVAETRSILLGHA